MVLFAFKNQELGDLAVSHVEGRSFIMRYDHCPDPILFQDGLVPEGFNGRQDGQGD